MTTLEQTWSDLDCELSPLLLKAITEGLGFTKVMPVQKSVVPVFSKNYDVAVEVRICLISRQPQEVERLWLS